MRTLLVAVALLTCSLAACADDTADCITASEKAQQLRDQQKLLEARKELLACGRDTCPTPVKKDCAELLADVMRRIPTIVLRVKGHQGEDLADATVSLDGQPIASHLDGQPMTVDPGLHEVRVQGASGVDIATKIVAVQGEHERLVVLDVGAPVPEPSRPMSRATGQRIAGVIIGVAGVAGVVIGTVYGLNAIDDKNTQISDCASNTQCTNPMGAAAAHRDAQSSGTISTVAFIAGGVVLAAGVIVFFTAPKKNEGPSVTVGFNGLGMIMRGAF